jgi:phage terminase large subunit GpA-like protein
LRHKLSRRIYAVKGAGGARPVWKQAQKAKGSNRLFIIGTDQLKLEIMERLAAETRRADGTQLRNSKHPHFFRAREDPLGNGQSVRLVVQAVIERA